MIGSPEGNTLGRVKFESHKEEDNMAAGFVYWIAEDKLQRLSEAFQLFKNHNGWKGEIACVFILGNVLGESDCDGISYINFTF